tara:strand:- start:759 stop:995 length:237 start_codon:yes stop_codon:yes gene_type:complete
MNLDLLDEVLSTLYRIRSELHDNVEGSVTQELDQAIEWLEEAKRNGAEQIRSEEILLMLGKIFDKLPIITRLIELLSG